ncbi:MAG: hypothetical protein WA673_07640 [Candidatus Acidiferrales bacterium]
MHNDPQYVDRTPSRTSGRRDSYLYCFLLWWDCRDPQLASAALRRCRQDGFSRCPAIEVTAFAIKVLVVEPSGFATDWAGSSMTVQTFLAEYEPVRQLWSNTRTCLKPCRAKMSSSRYNGYKKPLPIEDLESPSLTLAKETHRAFSIDANRLLPPMRVVRITDEKRLASIRTSPATGRESAHEF